MSGLPVLGGAQTVRNYHGKQQRIVIPAKAGIQRTPK